jgi:hypothetical protein
MGQLQGNTGLNIALAGRATGNPLVGKQDLEFALAGKADVNINLAAKFGLGFVSIINSRIVKMTFMLPDQGIGWTGYVSAKALKLSYLKN